MLDIIIQYHKRVLNEMIEKDVDYEQILKEILIFFNKIITFILPPNIVCLISDISYISFFMKNP